MSKNLPSCRTFWIFRLFPSFPNCLVCRCQEHLKLRVCIEAWCPNNRARCLLAWDRIFFFCQGTQQYVPSIGGIVDRMGTFSQWRRQRCRGWQSRSWELHRILDEWEGTEVFLFRLIGDYFGWEYEFELIHLLIYLDVCDHRIIKNWWKINLEQKLFINRNRIDNNKLNWKKL